jgi:hypothetical protein
MIHCFIRFLLFGFCCLLLNDYASSLSGRIHSRKRNNLCGTEAGARLNPKTKLAPQSLCRSPALILLPKQISWSNASQSQPASGPYLASFPC